MTETLLSTFRRFGLMSLTNNYGAKSASSRCGREPLQSSAIWPKIPDAW